MARAKKRSSEESKPSQGWMLTFSDMITLMLTFFVLLVSMSHMDERRKRDVLVSTQSMTGLGVTTFNPLGKQKPNVMVQPGPMTGSPDELESLREFLWENRDEDINIQSNRYVNIISISSDVLFEPGNANLSPKGQFMLDRIVPEIKNLAFPVLVAGHTSIEREEEQDSYRVMLDGKGFSSSWRLSLLRALAVYQFLRARGVKNLQIMNEAFGEYHPRMSNQTPEGRKANRRVDIILDKRNADNIEKLKKQEDSAPKKQDSYEINNFRFKLDTPPLPTTPAEPAPAPQAPVQQNSGNSRFNNAHASHWPIWTAGLLKGGGTWL